MSSTSADLLPAQSYKTAKHFPHQLMGIRSHFTTEHSSIKQTEKHQGNIHVKSARKHRCTFRTLEKNIQMGIGGIIHIVTLPVLFLASYSLC